MDKQIKIILQDLYAIDESFRRHEDELIKIINQLLVSRPDTKFDKKFARQLRAELLQRACALSRNRQVEEKTNLFSNMTNMFNVKKLSYASVGVIVILLAVVVWQYTTPDTQKLAFAPQITQVDDQAFGSLASEQAVSEGEDAVFGGKGSQAGGGDVSAIVPEAELGRGGGGGVAMPSPYAIKYNFIYQGEKFTVDEKQMAVLKRVKDKQASIALATKFGNLNFGGVDLSKFSNLGLQNISIVEDKDFGYMLTISPQEGTISINQNWQKWPHPESRCSGGDVRCFEETQLRPEDVPADEALIKIANDFLQEKGIEKSSYGEPEINKEWLSYSEGSYVGETVSITYPLIIDGKKVYEESGHLAGMNVSVNIRENKVSGLWNYQTQNYQSSDYEVEQDADRILKLAEQGSRYSKGPRDDTAETRDIKLGTPELAYAKIWQYGDGQSTELLAPALIFPVIEKAEEVPYYIQNIVVPLVKELLDEAEKRNNDARPIPPVPLIEAEVKSEE